LPGRASAKRYAQAVFDIARENDTLDLWADGLRSIQEAMDNEEFRSFLEHAKVPLFQKVDTVGEVLAGMDPLVQNLMSLLVSRGLTGLVPNIEKEYQRMLDVVRNREQVEVYSAVPLEDTEKERITQFLARLMNKEVVVNSRVDPSILAGLVIRVGDKLIDGSTRARLESLGKQLAIEGPTA
jgi:F-type H+-transporting ATPase subunit delta